MPNYVTNIIRMNGPKNQREQVVKYLGSDEQEVDFNKIVPMPKSLNITAGSMEDNAIAVYKYKKLHDGSGLEKMLNLPFFLDMKIKTVDELCEFMEKNEPNLVELGETYINNLKLYGATTWYDWRCNNWGTKWNAGDPWIDEFGFGFNTAWSDVRILIQKLSSRFGDIEFTYTYADEDFGSNLGKIVFKAGKVIDEYFPTEQSDEAYDFASEILGYDMRDEEYWEDE